MSQWNLFYVFLGAFFWQYLTPPVEQCVEFRLSWMALIAVRNVSFLWIWVGALHHLLYVWHVVPDKLKFNPSYPKKQQHYRDFLMSTSGALIDSAMQIGFMHLYATNKVPWYSDFWAGPQWAQQLGSWQGPIFSVAMILVGCLYQDFHFYWVHRYIHRWGWVRGPIPPPGLPQTALRAPALHCIHPAKLRCVLPMCVRAVQSEKSFPYVDPGRFLYKWVHSYHHKSYNPGPWSGLAMHPVEHLLYFTRSFVCLFVGLHPVHMIAAFSRSTLSPAPGHNG
eukprot:COSAG02_NODE_9872_length_2086_cov_1.567690_2_plen_279_part_00